MIRLVMAVVSLAMVILLPLAAFLGIIGPMPGFFGALLGAIAGLLTAVVGVISIIAKKRDWRSYLALACALPFVVIYIIIRPGLAVPPINDISTDLENPPEFTHAQTLGQNEGRDFDYPDEFKPQVEEAYADLAPLKLSESPEDAYARALETAKAQPGWEVTLDDAAEMTFEGVATTSFFKWKDDFIVRVSADGEGSKVDMRSKSRDGKSDLGANNARIKAFFEALK